MDFPLNYAISCACLGCVKQQLKPNSFLDHLAFWALILIDSLFKHPRCTI